MTPRGVDKPLERVYNPVTLSGKGVTLEVRVRTEDLSSVANAAKELGRPRVTIYRWIEAGKIVGIKLGGILFIPKSEVERLKNEKATGDEPVA
ncbi:hypothetical protein ES703_120694 [subsurface metagenome]